MLGSRDFEVIGTWVFKARWVSTRRLPFLGLAPAGLRRGQMQGSFWNHTATTNSVDAYRFLSSLKDGILPRFSWVDLASEHLPKCIVQGIVLCSVTFIFIPVERLMLRQTKSLPSVDEVGKWGKEDLLSFKAGTPSTRLDWLYRQRNVSEGKRGVGKMGIFWHFNSHMKTAVTCVGPSQGALLSSAGWGEKVLVVGAKWRWSIFSSCF